MRSTIGRGAAWTMALALLPACGVGDDNPGGAETAAGGSGGIGGMTTGGLATGGASTGGFASGGLATGGASTGGFATGGLPTGGASTGGFASGGLPTGGFTTGGFTTGGFTTGGFATGGFATGGLATGGFTTGGFTTGGDATGGFATGGNATGGFATGGEATGGTAGTGGSESSTPVTGLEISKVSLYQTVEIPLMQDWAEVAERPADIAQDKEALLRIFVARQSGWTARGVRAVVEVESAGSLVSLTAEQTINRDSADEELGSTLNVDVPATALAGGATYSVSLVEVGGGSGSGDSTRTRWPESGAASIGERSLDGGLIIHLVPIRYDADGSGRLPDTSDAQVALYREYFSKFYPVSFDALELTVTKEMPWSDPVSADGSGWNEILYGLVDFMEAEFGSPSDEYFYGLFNPADREELYCPRGCVAGQAFLAESPEPFWRMNAGVGLGYPGEYSAGTVVHELAHLHGRGHAPCGTTDADWNYPFPDGRTGTWGYDLADQILKEPECNDFMSYCENIWSSAYTYQGIFDWIVATNATPMIRGTPAEWQSLRIGSDGEVRLGPSYELLAPPGGIEIGVDWLDASLSVIETGVGYLTPLDSLPGGIVLVQVPDGDAAHVRVDGSSPVTLP